MAIKADAIYQLPKGTGVTVFTDPEDTNRVAIATDGLLTNTTDIVDPDPANALVVRNGKLFVTASADGGASPPPTPEDGEPEANTWA